MTSALWGTTWEVIFAKLTHPATPGRSFTAVQRDALRDHAIALRPRPRPGPALRIGAPALRRPADHRPDPLRADIVGAITEAGLSSVPDHAPGGCGGRASPTYRR